MAKSQTTRKQHRFKEGNSFGNRFAKDNQPSGEIKAAGWKKWREERHLTRGIIKELQEKKKMLDYIRAMVKLAKQGNPKAIDVITKCLEEAEPLKIDIQNIKILNVDPLGE